MGSGKRKIEIKKIENERAKMVTFSKRRQGLFKKASQYAATTGFLMAVLVFSPAGKPFIYGSPSFDTVVDSYLNGGQENIQVGESSTVAETDVWEYLVGLEEKMKMIESLEELMEVKTVLEEVRGIAIKRLQDMANEKFVDSLLNF